MDELLNTRSDRNMLIKAFSTKRIKYPLVMLAALLLILGALAIAYSSYFGLFGVLPSKAVGFLIAFYLLLLPLSFVLVFRTRMPRFIAEAGIVKRACMLLVCWLPFLLGFYPGNLWYHDTCFQVCQYFGNEMPNIFASLPGCSITDHHPILDTAIFGSFIQFGKGILGSENVGWFLFVLVQAVLTALVFSYGIQRCVIHSASEPLIAGITLFLGLCPLFPFSVGSMAKDMLNAPFFLLFCFYYADIVTSRSVSKKQMMVLIPLVLVVAFTKKTSLYLVIVALVIAVFRVISSNKIKLLCIVGVVVAVNSIFIPKVVYPTFNVSPGSSIEALALPIQQVSRAVIERPDEIGQEERSAIDGLIGYDTIPERYNPISSDGVKGIGSDPNVDYYPSTGQLLNFIKAWVTVGLKSPGSYIKATLELESGWLSLGFKPDWFNMLHEDGLPIQPPNGAIIIQRPAQMQYSADIIADTWFALGSISPLNLFFSPFVYCFVVPLLTGGICVARHKSLLPLVPIALSLVILLLSPVSIGNESVRYALPLIYSSVFLVAKCFVTGTGNRNRTMS